MTNVNNAQSARATAIQIVRRLDEIQRLSTSAPGIVRVATDGNGDRIAFWNSGTASMEYNLSAAQQRLAAIAKAYPDALKSRSGQMIQLPLIN